MLNDSEIASPAVRRNHRTYTPEFKTELVADCQRPGASIAAVATLHGINANVLHRWIKENRLSGSNRLTAQPAPPWTCSRDRYSTGASRIRIWCSPSAHRLPLCQYARQPHEGAGA